MLKSLRQQTVLFCTVISSSAMLKLILPNGYAFNTNDHGRSHAFRIFDEGDAAFDASAYSAPIVKVFDYWGKAATEPVTGSWALQSSGMGTFAFSPSNHLTTAGPHYIKVQLEKPGTIVSTERKKIAVFASP
jgi:hypothetical protein